MCGCIPLVCRRGIVGQHNNRSGWVLGLVVSRRVLDPDRGERKFSGTDSYWVSNVTRREFALCGACILWLFGRVHRMWGVKFYDFPVNFVNSFFCII